MHVYPSAGVMIENLFHNEDFVKTREFVDKLEQVIRIVLFYWGVVEKHDLLKEVSKQFGTVNNDSFQSTSIKLLKGLSGKTFEMQKVGSLEFFATLTEDISAIVWKVGRNDLCPCGSGKKYKKCCLK